MTCVNENPAAAAECFQQLANVTMEWATGLVLLAAFALMMVLLTVVGFVWLEAIAFLHLRWRR